MSPDKFASNLIRRWEVYFIWIMNRKLEFLSWSIFFATERSYLLCPRFLLPHIILAKLLFFSWLYRTPLQISSSLEGIQIYTEFL